MPVNLYYTQKVRGFQQLQLKYSESHLMIAKVNAPLPFQGGPFTFCMLSPYNRHTAFWSLDKVNASLSR